MGKWVQFTDTFLWHVPEFKGRVTKKYKPGKHFVKDDCAEKAIAQGRAKACRSPRKSVAVIDPTVPSADPDREWIKGDIGP